MPTGDLPRVPSDARPEPKQGWFEDPTGHHELRYFSQGVPTSLIRDGHVEGQDAISMNDPELFAAMSLAKHFDTGPEPHRPPSPPHIEWVFGQGPILVRDDVLPNRGRTLAEPGWYALALLPWLVGFPVCFVPAAPEVAFVALGAFSLTVAAAGATYRRLRGTPRC